MNGFKAVYKVLLDFIYLLLALFSSKIVDTNGIREPRCNFQQILSVLTEFSSLPNIGFGNKSAQPMRS